MKNSKLLFASLLFTGFSYSLLAQSNTYLSAPQNYNIVFETGISSINPAMTILNNGSVQINTLTTTYTSTPTGLVTFDNSGNIHPLSFNGNANTVLTGAGTFTTVSAVSPLQVSGNNLYYTTGNVGIGTSAPNAAITISNSTINSQFSVVNPTSSNNVFSIDQSGNTYVAGYVGINTTNVPSGYSLAINGSVIATDVYVELYNSWPDYVFDKNYKHRSLEELEAYLNTNHHLPGMPSAKEIKDKGSVSVGEVVNQNTKEIEELTLDLIELNKTVKALVEENKELEQKNKELKEEIKKTR